jgi:hypothetical protein
MALVMKIHHMEWCSTSGMIEIHPESTATAMKGVPADVQGQGQGHLANDVSGGEAIAETQTGGEHQIATVTVTGFVTGVANLPPTATSITGIQ